MRKMICNFQSVLILLLATPFPHVRATQLLFQDATIVTFSEATKEIEAFERASLLIENDQIVQIYASAADVDSDDVVIVNASHKIITPGFINTHHHLWQTAYKTLGSNTTLSEYFQRFAPYSPLSLTLNARDIYLGQLAAGLEMLDEGTTAWIDHAHGSTSDEITDAMLKGTLDCGGRSFFAPAIQDGLNYSLQDQFAKIRSLASMSDFQNNSVVSLGLAYDGFSTSTPDIREAILNFVHTINLSFITTHYVGGVFGAYNSPETLQAWNLLNTSIPIVFSHASHLSAADALLLRNTNQYISTTPESELHYGHGNPHLHRVQDQASLGVDTHFTFSSSMVTQARIWLQTLRGRLFQQQLDNWVLPINSPMNVKQAFYLATRAGALALRRPDLGIIAPGAKADLVIYDTTSPAMLGASDPVASIILHSNPGDITDVVVAGKFVKRDNRLVFAGYEKLRAEFLASMQATQSRYNTIKWPALIEGNFGGLGAYGKALMVNANGGGNSN